MSKSKKPETQSEADAIEWREYPRIVPSEYLAHCYWAKRYRDPCMRRWTCLLRWDVLSDDLERTPEGVVQSRYWLTFDPEVDAR